MLEDEKESQQHDFENKLDFQIRRKKKDNITKFVLELTKSKKHGFCLDTFFI